MSRKREGRGRILAAWMADPEASLAAIARRAGVSYDYAARVTRAAGLRRPRAPRGGGVKQRVIAAWQSDPQASISDIARASRGYTSKILKLLGRPPFHTQRQAAREIVVAWRRSTETSYNRVARLTGRSRNAAARASAAEIARRAGATRQWTRQVLRRSGRGKG